MGQSQAYRKFTTKGDSEEDTFIQVDICGEGASEYSAPFSAAEPRLVPLKLALFFSLLLNGGMILAALALYQVASGPSNPIFPQALYSPAQEAIEYETRVFHEGFGADRTIYQMPPSPEVDKAWTDLYNFGVSRVSKSIADKLVNSTYRIPDDEQDYVIQLDVFHQLHCLNMLRKSLYPDHYPEMRPDPNNLEDLHWSHCIESPRQSLTCSADISPMVWQWVDRAKQVKIVGNFAHTRRNYEKIKEWAMARRLEHELNYTGFI